MYLFYWNMLSVSTVVPQVWRHTGCFRSLWFEICISRSSRLSAQCYRRSCERDARWTDSLWELDIRIIRALHKDKTFLCHVSFKHFGSSMTLSALVPAAETACGDMVLCLPQHPVLAEAVLKPRHGPVYPNVFRCQDVTAQHSPGGPPKAAFPPLPPTFSRGLCGHPRGTGSGWCDNSLLPDWRGTTPPPPAPPPPPAKQKWRPNRYLAHPG